MLVLVATLIASYIFLSPLRFDSISKDAAATAVYIPNIWFTVTGTDYLADTAPSPFQQYWSLGVEEQFYLVWPLLMIVVWKLSRRSLRAIRWSLAVLLVVSLGLSIGLTPLYETVAFFNLPTRAWQFAVGSMIALAPATVLVRIHTRRMGAAILGWVGLGAVLYAGITFGEATSYPGWQAIVPTLGTALVIAASTPENRFGPAFLLNHKAAQWIGDRSYSWYLWHWPVIIIPLEVRGFSVSAQILLAGISLLLADLTYRFVENPVRNAAILKRMRSGRFIVASFVCVGLIAYVSVISGPIMESRAFAAAGGDASPIELVDGVEFTNWVPANLVPDRGKAKFDIPQASRDGCSPERYESELIVCEYGDSSSLSTIALYGDSHAAQWFPAALELARQENAKLIVLIKSGCSSIDVAPYKDGALDKFCVDWREAALERLAEPDVERVLLGSLHTSRDADGNLYTAEAWADATRQTVEALEAQAVVIGDTPFFSISPPECAVKNPMNLDPCMVPRDKVVDAQWNVLEANAAEEGGGVHVDPTSLYCTEVCGPIIGDTMVYRDNNHLTATFVEARSEAFAEMVRAAESQ